jgi:hypothetical protein
MYKWPLSLFFCFLNIGTINNKVSDIKKLPRNVYFTKDVAKKKAAEESGIAYVGSESFMIDQPAPEKVK